LFFTREEKTIADLKWKRRLIPNRGKSGVKNPGKGRKDREHGVEGGHQRQTDRHEVPRKKPRSLEPGMSKLGVPTSMFNRTWSWRTSAGEGKMKKKKKI